MHDVIVANGRYLGGGMKMLPDAEPDDGLFDVLLIGDLTKRDLLLTLPKTYRGRTCPHPKATLLRGATVEVEAPEPLPVELDGEQPGTTPVRFEIVPQRPPAARARLALRLRLGLRLGGGRSARAGLADFESWSTFFSSEVTRRSSASRPRTFFERSSTRSFSWFAFSTSFCAPGISAIRPITSSPRSASWLNRSCPLCWAMRAFIRPDFYAADR